jgi:hypothetical protein
MDSLEDHAIRATHNFLMNEPIVFVHQLYTYNYVSPTTTEAGSLEHLTTLFLQGLEKLE